MGDRVRGRPLGSCPRSAEALTPLHVAAAWGCSRSLELLLSQGADPRLLDQVRGPGGAEGPTWRAGGSGERGLGCPLVIAPPAGWTPATGPGRTAGAPGLCACPQGAPKAD